MFKTNSERSERMGRRATTAVPSPHRVAQFRGRHPGLLRGGAPGEMASPPPAGCPCPLGDRWGTSALGLQELAWSCLVTNHPADPEVQKIKASSPPRPLPPAPTVSHPRSHQESSSPSLPRARYTQEGLGCLLPTPACSRRLAACTAQGNKDMCTE